MSNAFCVCKRHVIGYEVLVLLLLVNVGSWAQTTYYVASSGSDADNGLSESSPVQSLTKVNTFALRPGDSVLFRRGDTFQGSLVINQSGMAEKPIHYGAYGVGAKPTLAGSVPVRNWTRTGGNRWQAACPDCGTQVTGLYKNGRAQPLGRYPNPEAADRGNLFIQAHVGKSQLTSRDPLTTDWTGGEVVVRTQYWIIDRATISGQQGNTLLLNNPSTYSFTDSWGFFIQNHPATLDQPGEWYYDPVRKVIHLYAGQEDPNSQLFTATAFDKVVRVTDAEYVSIRDLRISQARTTNLYALNVSNFTVSNTDIVDAGEDALLMQGMGRTVLMENNTITRSNNNGINIAGYADVTFRQNSIRHTGMLPGRGRSGDGQYTAFQAADVQNLLVERNIIDSAGYSGICVQNSTTIRQNLIQNFCMTKCDGGGVYLWNGKQLPMSDVHIQGNIILNGIGTPGALVSTIPGGAHGIFLDDCVEGTEVTDNTVADCQGFGIYLHAVSKVGLQRNTCFNNSAGQLNLYHYDVLCSPRGNVISQNVLVSKTARQTVACFESGADDLTLFGRMEENYYARPFHDEFSIRAVYNRTVGDDISLSQWQTQFRHDFTSKRSPLTFRDYWVKNLATTSYLETTSAVKSGGWETWSPYNNGQAVWTSENALATGSLTINFPNVTGRTDAYLLVYKGIRPVKNGKTYLIQFDVATPVAKKVAVFIRQRKAPYQDLTNRYEFMAEPARRHVEFALTVTADEADALVAFQLGEDKQPVFFTNIQLQEATIESVDPDTKIRLVYNPTGRDSIVILKESYRDVRNRYYSRQVSVRPFSSVILLRDTLPPADLELSWRADQTELAVNEITSVSLTVRNQSAGLHTLSGQVRWQCRIPSGLTLVSGISGQADDSLLTGVVYRLLTDTTFVFQLSATAPGPYTLAAQITLATYGDPDSTPDSGMGDGEDDQATLVLVASVAPSTEPVLSVPPIASQSPYFADPASVVYPNPAPGAFTFRAGNDVTELRVIDLTGRERVRLPGLQSGQVIQFGHALPDAPYLLYVQYKTGHQRVVKLIKGGRPAL